MVPVGLFGSVTVSMVYHRTRRVVVTAALMTQVRVIVAASLVTQARVIVGVASTVPTVLTTHQGVITSDAALVVASVAALVCSRLSLHNVASMAAARAASSSNMTGLILSYCSPFFNDELIFLAEQSEDTLLVMDSIDVFLIGDLNGARGSVEVAVVHGLVDVG